MKDPRKLQIQDFTYALPEERIAKYPLAERDASQLLIFKEGNIKDDVYKNLADYLPPASLLIFNNTKVVEARLLFQKPTGGIIELFCLEPHELYSDITTAMLQQGTVQWQCLVGGASKWKAGQVLVKQFTFYGKACTLYGKYIEKRADCFVIEFSWEPRNFSFAEILHYAGVIPLPPYLKRAAESPDAERYQTIYARNNGSVAAPTAGLHFTDRIFQRLKAKQIQTGFVTLHVGAGTFKPVKTATVGEHEMHTEWIDVSKQTLQLLLQNLDQPVVAVGTTSLRTIESLYWMGVKVLQQPAVTDLHVQQWEPYETATNNITTEASLRALLAYMDKQKTDRLITKTGIIIAPGYLPRVAKALITNFHQPQSTLLLLIAALVGDDWKIIYEHALQNGYRFLSYGDGSLLWVKNS
jgi:S-adenosylmethionine:tRNA ribosyltransferase-isomerase